MILGIGSDLIDCRRIERDIQRSGQKFIDRIFTPAEQNRLKQRQHQAASFAKIFAAKEAMAKALGTGIAKGISWQDIEVSRKEWSPPTINLSGVALAHLNALTPAGMQAHMHLSMTDEWPYAQAFVIISVIPL